MEKSDSTVMPSVEEVAATDTPRVSVLMPTFRHAPFIGRALESLLAQTWPDWELVIVDDGSPDETASVVAPYLADARIRYERLAHNGGLGAALNHATQLARGRYLAYLPSDDVFYPDHLARLVETLDATPDVTLAYGGVRYQYRQTAPTLQGEALVGREAEGLDNDNLLALVQVMHRRDHEPGLPWPTRAEVETDTLERDFWRALLARGGRFAYTGAVTCEWVQHAEQRHTLMVPPHGGLSRFRAHYGLDRDVALNFQPSRGMRVDERTRYRRFLDRPAAPAPDGLKILIVGELGFNPERIVALEERGHRLFGLWIPRPENWDATGPFPFSHLETIPYDRQWRERVRAVQPDVVYALLNWQALRLLEEVLDARLGIPFVFHFKEGPFICLDHGLWPTLVRLLTESDGQVFINDESRAWFDLALPGRLDPQRSLILDGDLPKADWQTDDWAPKLSAQDGELHTVCTGRPLGLDPFDAIAAAGIHVHFYGDHFHQQFPNWTRHGLATGYMHIHSTVEPSDWVRELSRYDAAWFHLFDSDNQGDLRRAHWDDLNLPARIGTYGAAGLPWLLKDNPGSQVAIANLARRHDIGVFFRDYADLAAQLRDRPRVAQLTANARRARPEFAFDTHVDELIQFMRRMIRS